MAPAARTYLSKALSMMEEHSLLRHRIDWNHLRSKAFAQARGAQKPADTYGAIESALGALGDGHSTFWSPEQSKETLDSSAPSSDPPRARSLKNGIGYVALPGVDGSQKTYDQYVRQGRAAVAKADGAGACGWVVDLRPETGGGMWPVLAVAGPILGDGTAGMFVDADGRKSVWSIKDGAPYLDGKSQGWSTGGRPLATSRPPVAVLTGRRTSSAGEAVAVAFRGRPNTRSFGEPTFGVPTGNASYRLSDGATLFITGVKDADRTGRTYDAPIPPDEEVVKDPRPAARHQDAVLDAAQNWLLEQAACRQR
ncbi:S41 family peptidase [Streptomyces mexicanus]|uniref:Peptidase S41 n=1 Tax=Streptomyces mexicanus TaxID=178566 RepID=A0A7X1I624_9ACTN|nr:S41 family peptidase [Streptomyces mexicanus]MBC2869442.1 peptidase S41 [Streptomyces mexicanus]